MSRFGLYFFGYYLVLAAQFVMRGIFVANKLGEPRILIPTNNWTVFLPLFIGVVIEIFALFVEASLRE